MSLTKYQSQPHEYEPIRSILSIAKKKFNLIPNPITTINITIKHLHTYLHN